MNWRAGLVVGAAALSGCATFHQARQLNDQAVAGVRAAAANVPGVVETVPGPYLMGPAVHAVKPPSPVLNVIVTLVVARPETIGEIAARIAGLAGVPVSADGILASAGLSNETIPALPNSPPGAGLPPPPAALFASATSSNDPETPRIAIRYHGKLSGLLDAVAARAGVSWRWRHDGIEFFRTESRTFLIPALPWATKASSEIVASAGASSTSGAVAGSSGVVGGGGGGATGGQGGASSVGSTSIVSSSTTDIWGGLQKAAQTVAGGAHVIADPSSGTLTVTGTPGQVAQVADWVEGLTETLSKQVAVTVRVYNVQLTNEQNYGFSPTLAFTNAAKSFGLSMVGAPAPLVASGATPFSFAASVLNTAQGAAGEFAGTQAAVQALATLGRVTQVFTRSIVTLNGEPAPIQVAEQTGYLAESEISQSANVGSTTGLIPGTVTTGFTGTFLPRIVRNRILLGMSITISSLVDLKTVSSGGASIQVPTTTDTVIQQSAALQSGSTLMITGYKEADGSRTNNGVGSPYFAFLGGGGDAQVKHQMIAIVVTARTL